MQEHNEKGTNVAWELVIDTHLSQLLSLLIFLLYQSVNLTLVVLWRLSLVVLESVNSDPRNLSELLSSAC
jgi:hypothetical protein